MICEKTSPGPTATDRTDPARLVVTAPCGPSQLGNEGCPKSTELKPSLEHTDVSGETPVDYSAREALLWPPLTPG